LFTKLEAFQLTNTYYCNTLQCATALTQNGRFASLVPRNAT